MNLAAEGVVGTTIGLGGHAPVRVLRSHDLRHTAATF